MNDQLLSWIIVQCTTLNSYEAAGILVLFLPPYSPDYNPIEELFGYVKYYLKEHDDILQVVGDITPMLKSAFDSVISSQCKGWITHAG